jgi:hypothetical protein
LYIISIVFCIAILGMCGHTIYTAYVFYVSELHP